MQLINKKDRLLYMPLYDYGVEIECYDWGTYSSQNTRLFPKISYILSKTEYTFEFKAEHSYYANCVWLLTPFRLEPTSLFPASMRCHNTRDPTYCWPQNRQIPYWKKQSKVMHCNKDVATCQPAAVVANAERSLVNPRSCGTCQSSSSSTDNTVSILVD